MRKRQINKTLIYFDEGGTTELIVHRRKQQKDK